MESELSSRGYSMTLRSLPSHFLENIKRELYVKPLENPNFPGNTQGFPVYRLSKSKIYLPRYYGFEKYKEAKTIKFEDPESIEVPFQGTLRPVQQETIDKTLDVLGLYGGGIISLDTGLGKTVVALNLVSLLQVKSIIVVHAEFLLDQWVERIKQYLPTARIGIIRQERCEIENVDIVVAMLQTVINREINFKGFGLLTVDECFPYDETVVTSKGNIKIGKLYNLWRLKLELPLILSYNKNTDTTEYKKMTYAWKKTNENLLKITYISGSFSCTENHKILTPTGYVRAYNLDIGDVLQSSYETLIIISIEKIKNNQLFVYDIEVEDNHNFIIGDELGPVVHNCHHTAAHSFSSIFYKVQTKYMIGLSATPDRKDGLTKVLYWFLGPQIVNIKRETDKPSIRFVETDTKDYIEHLNRIGKINSPIMITELSKHKERNFLIVGLIKHYLTEKRKILVLSDRREHCEYLCRFLSSENVSAGVYLGGMKSQERSETIGTSVILGTYQASGEGFDVPELDTLILATPKSDVQQAVGRILRQKNANKPLVIDIVDQFSIFKGQYYKRRRFYKNEGFFILK
jgi:superfamily II DNA or RNA helicase